MRAIRLALPVLMLLALPAWGGPVRCSDDGEGGACVWGRAEAFDSGRIQLRGLSLQLMGVAVPAHKELCQAKGGQDIFDCARPARKRMAEWLAKGVACDIIEVAGDRLLGRCRVAAGDLGRLLVAEGLARAAKDGPFDADQAAALAARKGLWSGDVALPRDWETARKKGDKGE
ncbi:thermonuclease family protein [Magnetospirillum sp. UT-4]|uniref:thermonuclease family protein n=1 Tax=Magnetospirillum sp. UT-4 TaxID=2681467 RepID=UPI001572E06E|nr:nuclease [Magnetospirillum sp. UT-4]